MVWAGWLYSQEWWWRAVARRLAERRSTRSPTASVRVQRADANDYILQARTWERRVGSTPASEATSNGRPVDRNFRCLHAVETDLYFPIGDALRGAVHRQGHADADSSSGHTAGAASIPPMRNSERKYRAIWLPDAEAQESSDASLLLDECFEPADGHIPLRGDPVEVVCAASRRSGSSSQSAPSVAATTNQPRARENVEVLGDRLTGDLILDSDG
jgi:hypothetical protein